ncbi:hypothetical protein C8A05DRAFT_38065 [Staphylotrichum tortipilum]|uniref:Uncharacterized protein n=1 Tax=Staphylotrichum tortipilum TaxID=2831512 RepID=A0AAN6MDL0_9PEZI|nr:hypothetical protein C8A05DRAFT_38065 [Staphylotrichum longicolle]
MDNTQDTDHAADSVAGEDDRYSNRYPWRAGRNPLPYAGPARLPDTAAGPDTYTAHVLNCMSSPGSRDQHMSSTDPVHQIGELCRLLDVRRIGDGRSVNGESSCIRLDLSDSMARSAVAAHVKLDAINALPCAHCAGPSPTGPFASCIATTKFDGACTNCVYAGRDRACTLAPRPRPQDGVLLPQHVGYTGDWTSPSVDRLGCRNVRALLGLLSGKDLRFVESRARSCLLAGRPTRGYQKGSVSGIDIMYNLSRLLPSLEADEVRQLLEILADVMAFRGGEV